MKKANKAFTLIEMLIVLGIVAVITVVIVVTINPIEAQKRSRDAKRMKDRNTISTLLGQYIWSGGVVTGCLITSPYCQSSTSNNRTNEPCDNNWLQLNLCAYTKTVPVDPLNALTIDWVCAIIGSFRSPAFYKAGVLGSDYKVSVPQEAKSNLKYITEDGGSIICGAETGTNLTIF